jgi:hypothetical protein
MKLNVICALNKNEHACILSESKDFVYTRCSFQPISTITVAVLWTRVLESLLAEICATFLKTDKRPAEPFHSPGTHCCGQADHSDHGDTWQSTGQTCQHSRFETGLWSGWQLEHNHATCWDCIHCYTAGHTTTYCTPSLTWNLAPAWNLPPCTTLLALAHLLHSYHFHCCCCHSHPAL